MKMRAAVLEEFGQPLNVTEVDLADPGPGEALVRLVACGVCHTDMYTASGVDPSGYAPTVLGHEGAGVVEAVGEGVADVKVGDHVVTLFSPQCRECEHCLLAQDQPVHRDPRRAGQGPPARRHHEVVPGRRADPPLHGHVDLRRVHGHAADRSGRRRSRGAARARGAVRLRAFDRARRGDQHGQGRGGLDLRGLRRGHGRPRRRGRRPPAGRRADRLRGPLRRAAGPGARPRGDRRHRTAARTRSSRSSR